MTALTGERLHLRLRELAAAALDFPLSAAEAVELDAHLASCPACARLAGSLRFDAVALRRPAELVPSYRLDAAIGAAIAGRPARRSPQRTLLLVAATAFLLVAILGAAAVGAFLLRELRPPLVVDPSPSPPVVVVDPSPVPSGEPAPSGEPGPAVVELASTVVLGGFDDLADLVLGPDGAPYTLDRATKAVYRVDVETGEANPIFEEGTTLGAAEPRYLAAAGPDVLVLDAESALWRYRPDDDAGTGAVARVRVEEAAQSGSDIRAISAFVRDPDLGVYNLYVVDPSERQILRYTPAADDSGFPAAASAYLAAPGDVSAVTSVLVDGDVYLANGGSLARYRAGRPDDWPVAEAAAPARAYVLLASPNVRGEGVVYAYDAANEVIVELSKASGSILRELRLGPGSAADDRDVRGMYATRDTVTGATRLWWTNGNFLLTAAIPAAAAEPTDGQILVDLGEPRGVRVVGLDGEVKGDAPAGSLAPMAAWSPDGSRVAVTTNAEATSAVVIHDVESGAELARIDGAYAPSWSPDGDRLAYCRGQVTEAGAPCPEVWLASADGSGAERLGGDWHGPLAWSPDGRWLLGRTLGTGSPEPFALVDVASGTATPLGDPAGCYDDPAWLDGPSATGGDGPAVIAIRDLACTGAWPTPTVVVALDPATGAETRLTDGSTADGDVAVSPDGRFLAVARSLTGRPGGPYGIVVMPSDGSAEGLLTPDGATDSGPAWSPDGLWILVMRESFADGPGDPLGLRLLDPGSSTTIAVTGTSDATGWAWRPPSSPSTAP